MKAWVSRTAMNSQEIKISVKASEYGIFLVIFHEIGGCRCQEMGARHSKDKRKIERENVPISSSVPKGVLRQAQTNCGHLCDAFNAVASS